jgi:two-component system, sensor histidine kinase and response regulator
MKNILLIENDKPTVIQIVKALNNESNSFDFAESGVNGYSMALRKLPDIVICNNKLFQDEFNVNSSSWRGDSFLSTVPFIFLLEKDSSKFENYQTSELDYFIRKPFQSRELVKIFDLAISKFDNIKKKSDEKLDQLRGSISFLLPHEFFTPLNGILGFSDILIKDLNNLSKDEILEMLGYIRKDANRLKKLTENFVTFAQLEIIEKDQSKITDLRNSYFLNPAEAISAAAKKIAQNYSREDDISIEIQNSAIRMSEEFLKKMIFEIVDNSFKFSSKGNVVNVNLLSNDSSVMIEVSDNGIGMTIDQIASIGAYMQFNRSKLEQQGSGLGLIIAKKIAELHRGTFRLESALGEGTKVSIIFEI